MNKTKAEKLLTAAAPKFKVSAATKSAYKKWKNSAAGKTNWGKQTASLTDRLLNYGEFDPQTSAFYQKAYNTLRDTYLQRGRQNMADTMATAAATNNQGYGTSYATTAGNAAFQQQLNALADRLPTLYQGASADFENGRSALQQALGAASSMWNSELGNAQFAHNAFSGLDEQKYNDAVYRDQAKRTGAKFVLGS